MWKGKFEKTMGLLKKNIELATIAFNMEFRGEV